MNHKKWGLLISIVGLIILSSSVVYPMGYTDNKNLYNSLIILGATIIVIGALIRHKSKEKK